MRNRTILQVGKRLNCFNVSQTQFNHFTCFGIQQLREMMTLEGRWDRKKYIRDNKINFYNNFSTKIESASFPELRNDLQHKNEVKERSYVILYRQQLAHLRSTNNPEATVNLFSEMKQTGLPLPGKLYEEVFLALNASNRFQQVESMYLEMRRDKIIPSVNCFYIRLQALINCIDRAKEKGEGIFWLDKKLKDIMVELKDLIFTPLDPKIYANLILLATKANSADLLVDLWREYTRLFPKAEDAPATRITTTAIKVAAERFESAKLALQIYDDATLLYRYLPVPSLLTGVCLRALASGDCDTALNLLPSIVPHSVHLLISIHRCAAQTGNMTLFDLANSQLSKKFAPEEMDKFLPWKLYTLARAGKTSEILNILSSPKGHLVQHQQLKQISALLFASPDEVDAAYFYLERIFQQNTSAASDLLYAFDFIIVSCGIIKDFSRASETFEILPTFNLKPQISTFNSLLYACWKTNSITVVPEIYQAINDSCLSPTAETYEYLAKIFLASETLPAVVEVIKKATEAGIVLLYSVYEGAIKALVTAGKTSHAQTIIDQMKSLSVDYLFMQQYISNFPTARY